MPLAVGALNERHARHDARQGACAFFVGRITLLHRPGHRAAALRSTLAGLGTAARLIHKREHGATRPSRAGLPDSESTRNLPLRGKPLPLGERREPVALSSLVRRESQTGELVDYQFRQQLHRAPIRYGSLSYASPAAPIGGRQCEIVSRQVRCTGVMHPGGARNIAVLTGSRNSNQLPPPPPAPEAAPERRPARYVTVDDENDGRRIDNFLHSELPDVPRDRLHRLLRRGEVRVDGSRARSGRRLLAGEAVRIPPLVASFRERRTGRGPPLARARRIDDAVVYEDDRLIVLNKPAGLAVHGGSGISYGVIELLRAARPASRYLELVHRLDRDTSGCLLIAKRRSTLRVLHDALRRRSLDKRYLALLGGTWSGGGRRRVDLPLRRDLLSGGERMVRVSDDGRESVTELAAIATGSGVTLAQVVPHTGRTHQIRVHCAALGHPVAGDPKYGDRALNRRLRSSGLRRLFLHAESIRIVAPGLPEVIVRAGLDAELVAVAERMGIPGGALSRYRPSSGAK